MDNLKQRALIELKNFRKAFKSTIDCQKYEVNVFDCLNARYIEAGKIIEDFERGEKENTGESNCTIFGVMPRELYTSAIREWGEEAQMLMAIEECSELIQALTKVWRGKHSKSNIEEEIADVEIMIDQLKIIFDAGGVADWRKTKLERLHKLIHGA